MKFMIKFYKFLLFTLVFGFYSNITFSQNLTALVENSSDNKPIPSVHECYQMLWIKFFLWTVWTQNYHNIELSK